MWYSNCLPNSLGCPSKDPIVIGFSSETREKISSIKKEIDMAMKLYVGGLAFSIDDQQLADAFAEHGTVTSAQVIVDRDSNRSKGFGFVEFENDEEAKAAMAALNGAQIAGRSVTVNEARPKEDRGPRNFGGGSQRSY
jgi:RNA recognition motif-containing protein